MKKYMLLTFTAALFFSCGNNDQPNEEVSEELKQETLKIENNTQELEESIQDSEMKLEETQTEIDTLLNDI